MELAYPGFLFALFLLVIPILIHLFHFRKYKTIYFSSLTFVKSVEQEQNSPRKLKHLLILITRLLALAALIFAFTKPYFPAQNEAAKNNQLLGVYVDNSFSMSRIGSQGEMLNQAKNLAISVVEEAPRNTKFLLFTNELDGSQKKLLNRNEALEALGKIDYSPLHRTKKELLTFWDNWLGEYKKETNEKNKINLVYLSDFQKDNNIKLTNKFNNIVDLSPVQLTPVNAGNLFVDSIWFASPLQQVGVSQTLYARIQNSSDEVIESGVVSVSIGGIKRELFTSMQPFGQDTVELSYYNQNIGNIQCSVRINDKQMTQDDSYYFNYEVKKYCKVLIVNGEDAVSNVMDVYSLDKYFQTKSISTKELSSFSSLEYDLIVLNGLNQFSSFLNSKLLNFIDEKGTLLMLPGTSVSIGSWNAFLKKINLPEISSVQTAGLTIKKINYQDPFFYGVFEHKPENINLPTVSQAYRYQKNSSSLFLPLINYQNGSAFLMKTTDDKHVYFITTSLSPSFSTFVSNQLFSTVLLHIGKLSQNASPLFLTIGSDSRYPVKNTIQSESPITIRNKRVEFTPKIYEKNQVSYLSVSGIEAIQKLEAGNYEIVQKNNVLSYLSLNYNRKESITKKVGFEEIKSDFDKLGIQINQVQDGSKWNSASLLDINQHRELWRIFVTLAGFFLLCEMLVQIFYKK